MSNSFWDQIATANGEALRSMPSQSREVVVFSSGDTPAGEADRLVTECVRALKPGGLLFVYGEPRELPHWGERFDSASDEGGKLVFKYWIALEIDDTPRGEFLKPSHRGLLLYVKQPLSQKKPTALALNTENVKVAHAYCAACGQNVKDWGGKKHLMNPKGVALSDVWRDLPKARLKGPHAPELVLERIGELVQTEGQRGLHVVQLPSTKLEKHVARGKTNSVAGIVAKVERDQVVLGDCIEFLNGIAEKHPEGVFDLAFADPPYNLAKKYDSYDDTLADREYLDWCNRWLDGMVRTLKPGGSLFVLNLPKWAIHHAVFLNPRMDFRHWIAWEALSDPRGKLMPAHYALLYYTKPGAAPVFNYSPVGWKPNGNWTLPPDAPKYCLRSSCVKKRKALGNDERVELSDVWFDVHRIKHKRDRDAHPCQLPDKLMERIIRLTTNPGGLVFDPFCGAGTTAIAARKLGRHFVTTECDANYVRITNEKLAAMKEHADLFGEYIVPRKVVRKENSFITKKAIETFLQELALKLARVPTAEEINQADPEMLAAIDRVYPSRSAALKRCKVALVS